MDVDYSPRAAGKTTRMIEWLRANPQRLLITINHLEENRLKRLYPDVSTRILDWESYRHRYPHGAQMKEAAIDNADIVLEGLLRQRLAKISITDDRDR